MILILLLLIFWIISTAIYGIMTMQRMFKDVLPDWDTHIDDREIGLFLMALLGGWMFAPYFVWLLCKWMKMKLEDKK